MNSFLIVVVVTGRLRKAVIQKWHSPFMERVLSESTDTFCGVDDIGTPSFSQSMESKSVASQGRVALDPTARV